MRVQTDNIAEVPRSVAETILSLYTRLLLIEAIKCSSSSTSTTTTKSDNGR